VSRYADKRRRSVPCAVPDCDHEATTLRVVDSRPDWFCIHHAQVLDQRRKKS